MSDIVTGDDVALPVTLRKAGQTFLIDAGATIEASLRSGDKRNVYIDPVTLDNAATGVDLANSLIIVEFSSSETATIPEEGICIIEIQVNDTANSNGKLTWFVSAEVEFGTIA